MNPDDTLVVFWHYGIAFYVEVGAVLALMSLLWSPWLLGPEILERWNRGVRPVLVIVIAAAAVLCCSSVGLDVRPPAAFVAVAVFLNLALLLALKLYSKWVSRRLTPAERAPGLAGFAAWLSLPNLATVGVMGACTLVCNASASRFGELTWEAWTILLLWTGILLALLLAYPAVQTLGRLVTSRPKRSAQPRPAPERDRVLRLLEQQRITPEDAAELLTALANCEPAATERAPAWTASRKLMLAGAALVLVGFFFPWFTLNLANEVQRLTGSTALPFTAGQPVTINGQTLNWPPQNVPLPSVTISVAGGDIEHGLGWLILALALASATVPYIATGLPRHTQRTVMWIGAAAAAVIALYLLTRNVSAVSFGLPMAIVGLLLELIGLAWELPPAAAPDELDPAVLSQAA